MGRGERLWLDFYLVEDASEHAVLEGRGQSGRVRVGRILGIVTGVGIKR